MSGVDVYLGMSEGAVALGTAPAAWSSHTSAEAGIGPLLSQAAALMPTRWRRTPVRLWLSGALARPFLCGPVGGLKRWHEALSFARACAPEATGIAPECVVTLEAWPNPEPALAVAVMERLLDAVESAASEHRVQLRSIRPWWAVANDHVKGAEPGVSLVAAVDTDSLTVVQWRDDRVYSANAYLPQPTPEQAQALLARLALTSGSHTQQPARVGMAQPGGEATAGLPFGCLDAMEPA